MAPVPEEHPVWWGILNSKQLLTSRIMAIMWALKVTEMWREKFQGQTASEEIWSMWKLERCIGICLWGLWDRAIQGQSEPGGQ